MKTLVRKNNKLNIDNCRIALIFGIIAHLVMFIANLITGDSHCDEMMTYLNARSLADYQTDIAGEHLPFYFDTWIWGGQSPFATYIAALFIKAFGYSLFTARLPMFLISIVGLYFFYKALCELTDNKTFITICIILCGISPLHMFNGAYTLDCNYIQHLVVIGCYFLIKAIKNEKSLLFAVAMVFFGLGFYCYIASVYIIPVMLVLIYLPLIIKKKISIKNTILSVAVITVVALPFILWGLVLIGKIQPFELFGFSFTTNTEFAPQSKLRFTDYSMSTFGKTVLAILNELGTALLLIIFPDSFVFNYSLSIFRYTNFVGGIATVFAICFIIVSYIRKSREEKYKIADVFAFSGVIGIFFFAFISTSLSASPYRVGTYQYIIIALEGYGFYLTKNIFNSIDFKKIFATFICISIVMTTFNYGILYAGVTVNRNTLFCKPYYQALDYAQESESKQITVYNSKSSSIMVDNNQRICLYLYSYYYGKKNFCSFKDDMTARLAQNYDKDNQSNLYDIKFCTDDSVVYAYVDRDSTFNGECAIIANDDLKLIKFDKSNYNIKEFGLWSVITKK